MAFGLQVSGEAVLRGLKSALAAAPDAAAAAATLEGYVLAVRLAGVLGLDALCESAVDGEQFRDQQHARHLVQLLWMLHPGGLYASCLAGN